MAKSSSLFIWSFGTLLGCAVFAAVASALFYCALSSDAHTWPYLSEVGQFQWQIASLLIAGGCIVMFVFLLLKETLKRRNFDLDTLNDETGPPEQWRIWLAKTFITHIALFGMLLGGTLLLKPVLNATFKLNWIIILITSLMIFTGSIASEIIRRWQWKRKIAARKPSHLA